MTQPLLQTLIALSRIDASLARIFAEKKKLEADLAKGEAELVKTKTLREAKSKVAEEKRTRARTEEKSQREEQDKLVARRKALETLGNYKLQQAGIREIEATERQLSARDDALIKYLEESEVADKELAAVELALSKNSETLKAQRADTIEHLKTLEERRALKAKEREEIVPRVLPATLTIYQRVTARFPADPVVPVKNASCAGCNLQVAAQLTVQLHKGDSVVQCRGCGRLLFLESEQTAAQEGKTN